MSGQESLPGWAARVSALAQESDGVDRAVMPTSWGGNVWTFDTGNAQ